MSSSSSGAGLIGALRRVFIFAPAQDDAASDAQATPIWDEPSKLRATGRLLFGTPMVAVASSLLIALVLLAVFGPIVFHQNPTVINVGGSLSPPSWSNPMGTDEIGRSVFARFDYGARLSLTTALVVAVSGALIGTFLGVVCGTVGGAVDGVSMRVMDAILAFPPLILAMAITVSLGAGVTTAAIGILITSVPWYARLVRADSLSIRERPFIEAARAIGCGRWWTIRRHVLPHVMSTVLVQGASVFGFTVLTLAALGFVGLGAQPPTAEWGTMITEGLQYAITGQWWIGVFPGVGLLIAISCTAILADRIRDVLDPRSMVEL
jgi:peptide/nickel transport system permease protein